MSSKIDTEIQHHFLSDDQGYRAMIFFSGLIVVLGIWGQMLGPSDDLSSQRLYILSYVGLPLGILSFVATVWALKMSERFAVTVDRDGIKDFRLTDQLIYWNDVKSLKFRKTSRANSKNGHVEIKLKDYARGNLSIYLRARLTGLMLFSKAKKGTVRIESFGVSSGIAGLESVLSAFAQLHPHIVIISDGPAVSSAEITQTT